MRSRLRAFSRLRLASLIPSPLPRTQGELLDGGGDVSKSTSAQDVVYLVAIVHVLAIASSYAWLLLLAIPGAASLWLWRTVLSPYIFSARDGEGDAPRGRGGRGGKAERRGAKGTPRR